VQNLRIGAEPFWNTAGFGVGHCRSRLAPRQKANFFQA
jgi:hypothetical protein